MDFYEIGVYLVIIVVASACVFGVMWLLMRSMQPKRKPRRQGAPALAAAGNARKEIARESSVKLEDKGGKKKSSKEKEGKKDKESKKEKLLKLKDLPDGKLLAESEAGVKDSSKQEKAGFLLEQKDDKQTVSEEGRQPVSMQEKKPEEKNETQPQDAGQENAGIDLPDLPSLDTLDEGQEETGAKEENVDLMSVFETDEDEDSATSDLAANLFDVDVQNIEKLSSEVAEFLGGMSSK